MDSTPAFLREGYASSARVFYERDLTRRGALPGAALTLLQDEGRAPTLDDEPHRHRKGLFLDVLSRGQARELAQAAAHEWERAAERRASSEGSCCGSARALGEAARAGAARATK